MKRKKKSNTRRDQSKHRKVNFSDITFLLPQHELGIRRIILLGLDPPARSVASTQHNDSTSKTLKKLLGHNRFDWIDFSKRCAADDTLNSWNRNNHFKEILADPQKIQRFKTEIFARIDSDPNNHPVLYVCGEVIRRAVEKFQITLTTISSEMGIFSGQTASGKKFLMVFGVHPTAAAQSGGNPDMVAKLKRHVSIVGKVNDLANVDNLVSKVMEAMSAENKLQIENIAALQQYFECKDDRIFTLMPLSSTTLIEDIKCFVDHMFAGDKKKCLLTFNKAPAITSMLHSDRETGLETLRQVGALCGLTPKTWPTIMCNSLASMLNSDRETGLETLRQVGALCGLTPKTWPVFMCDGLASMLNSDRETGLETLRQVGALCGLTSETWVIFISNSACSKMKKHPLEFHSVLRILLNKIPAKIIIKCIGNNMFASRLFRITNPTILLYDILLKHRLQDKFIPTFTQNPAMLDALGTITSHLLKLDDSEAIRELVESIPKSYAGKTAWEKEFLK
jgi:hypothetical protein